MYKNRKSLLCPLRGAFAAVVLLAGVESHASMVISEVFYDAAGSDNGLTFVELFGVPGTILDGLLLEGVNGSNGAVYRSIPLSGEIPADGIFVVADDRGDGTSLVGHFDQVAEVDFQNGPDSVVLRDVSGAHDALGYGDFSTAIFAGEGEAATDVPAGSSLARFDPLFDSNNNRVDFARVETPTPGSLAVATVPVPAALVLFMSGLAGLASIARRVQVARV